MNCPVMQLTLFLLFIVSARPQQHQVGVRTFSTQGCTGPSTFTIVSNGTCVDGTATDYPMIYICDPTDTQVSATAHDVVRVLCISFSQFPIFTCHSYALRLSPSHRASPP